VSVASLGEDSEGRRLGRRSGEYFSHFLFLPPALRATPLNEGGFKWAASHSLKEGGFKWVVGHSLKEGGKKS